MRLYPFILSCSIPFLAFAQFNTVGRQIPLRAVIEVDPVREDTLVLADSVGADCSFDELGESAVCHADSIAECGGAVIESVDTIVESVDSVVDAVDPIVDSVEDAPLAFSEAELLEMRRILLSRRFLFHPPLKGRPVITSRFGYRANPFSKNGREFHCGIDLAAPCGSTVYAMLPGVVQRKGYDARAGNFLTLRSGQYTLTYCHLESIPSIPIGTHVLPGQPIALSGSTGRSTGPHLHITLKRNGRVIDPTILFKEEKNKHL